MTDYPSTIKEVPLPKSKCIKKFRLWDFDHDCVFVGLKDRLRKKLFNEIKKRKTRPAYFGMSQFIRNKWVLWFKHKRPIKLASLFWLGAAAGVSFEELERGVDWVVTGKGEQYATGGRKLSIKFPLELTPDKVRLLMYFLLNFTRGTGDLQFNVIPYRKDTHDLFLKDLKSNVGRFSPEVVPKPLPRRKCPNCTRNKGFPAKCKKCPICGAKTTLRVYKTYPFPAILFELFVGWMAKGGECNPSMIREKLLRKNPEIFIPKIATASDELKIMCVKALCDNTLVGRTEMIGFNCGEYLMEGFCELLDNFKIKYRIRRKEGHFEPCVYPAAAKIFGRGGALQLESLKNLDYLDKLPEKAAVAKAKAYDAKTERACKNRPIRVVVYNELKCCGERPPLELFEKCRLSNGKEKRVFDQVYVRICPHCKKILIRPRLWVKGKTIK